MKPKRTRKLDPGAKEFARAKRQAKEKGQMIHRHGPHLPEHRTPKP